MIADRRSGGWRAARRGGERFDGGIAENFNAKHQTPNTKRLTSERLGEILWGEGMAKGAEREGGCALVRGMKMRMKMKSIRRAGLV
jgi:hypothetical protein